MNGAESTWMRALAQMEAFDPGPPPQLPPGLPPDTAFDYWFAVARAEMSTRDTLSAKIRSLVTGEAPPAMTPLELSLYRLRVQWACQVLTEKAAEGVEPNAPLTDVIEWLLVDSWHSDGCIALWNHAERSGAPPAAGWLSPW